jgi:hypothetical protein
MEISQYNNTVQKQNQEQKSHMIISTGTEKTHDKIQHPFLIKALKKLRIEGKYLNLIKVIYNEHIANIILNGKKLKSFPLK